MKSPRLGLRGGTCGSVPGGRIRPARGDCELRSPAVVLCSGVGAGVAGIFAVGSLATVVGGAFASLAMVRTCSVVVGQEGCEAAASEVDAVVCACGDRLSVSEYSFVVSVVFVDARALARVLGFTLPCAVAPFDRVDMAGSRRYNL